MDKKQALKTGRDFIIYLKRHNYNINRAYLFGSYAKGSFTKDSDIDIACVFKNISNTYDMQIQLMKLRRRFDIRIEPHPFEEDDFNEFNPLSAEILKYGIQI